MRLLELLGLMALYGGIGVGLMPVLGFVRRRRVNVRALAVAPFLGIAVGGVLVATLAIAGVAPSVEVVALLALVSLTAGSWRLLKSPPERPDPESPDDLPFVDRLATVLGVSAVAVLFGAALRAALVTPVAEYDAWAMWSMKAKALDALGGADPALFSAPAYAALHLDYPLLIPAVEATALDAWGAFDTRLVTVQFLFVGAAGTAALWGLLADRVRPAHLWPFLVLVAAAPDVTRQLLTAYADVPLAFLVAAAGVAACRWLLEGGGHWAVVMTLFASAAVLTKNEGLLFAAALYGGVLLADVSRWRTIAVAAAAAVAPLVPWRIYTSVHDVGGGDFRLSDSFDLAWVAARVERGVEALLRLLGDGVVLAHFGLLAPLAALAVLAVAWHGPRRPAVFACSFAAASVFGLAWSYVISRLDLVTYLNQSAGRVIVTVVVTGGAIAPLLVQELARRPSRTG